MFRALVKAILKYDNEQSVVAYQLVDTLKKDIREDAIQAFEQSEALIEKHPHLFQSSSSFVHFLFRLCGATFHEPTYTSSSSSTHPPPPETPNKQTKDELARLKNQIVHLEKEVDHYKKNEKIKSSWEEEENKHHITKLRQLHEKEVNDLKEELEQIKIKHQRERKSLQTKLDDTLLSLEKCEKDLKDCQRRLNQSELECTSLQRQLKSVEQNKNLSELQIEKWKGLADQAQEEKSMALTVQENDRISLKSTITHLHNVVQHYEKTFHHLRYYYQLMKQNGLFNYSSQTSGDTLHQSFMSVLYGTPTPVSPAIETIPNSTYLPPPTTFPHLENRPVPVPQSTPSYLPTTIPVAAAAALPLPHSENRAVPQSIPSYPPPVIPMSYSENRPSQPSYLPMVPAPEPISYVPTNTLPLPHSGNEPAPECGSALALPNLLTSQDVEMTDSQKKTFLRQLSEDLKECQTECNKMQNENEEMKQTIHTVKVKCDNLQCENEELKESVQSLQTKLNTCEEEKYSLKLQLEGTEADILPKIKQLVHKIHDMYSLKLYNLSNKLNSRLSSSTDLFPMEKCSLEVAYPLHENPRFEEIIRSFLDQQQSPIYTLESGLASETVEKQWTTLEEKLDRDFTARPITENDTDTKLDNCLQELENVRREKETELANHNTKLANCQKELEKVFREKENELANHNTELENYRLKLEKFRQEKETEIANTKKKLTDCQQELHDVHQKKEAELNQYYKDCEEEIKKSIEDLSTRQKAQIDELRKTNEDYRDTMDREQKKQEKQIQELEEKVSEYERKLQDEKDQVKYYEKALKGKNNEILTLREVIGEKENNIIILNQTIENTNVQNKKLEQDYKNLQNENEQQFKEYKSALVKQSDELHHTINQFQLQLEQIMERNSSLNDENQFLRNQCNLQNNPDAITFNPLLQITDDTTHRPDHSSALQTVSNGLFNNFATKIEPKIDLPIEENGETKGQENSDSMDIIIQTETEIKIKDEEIQNLKDQLQTVQNHFQEQETVLEKTRLNLIDIQRELEITAKKYTELNKQFEGKEEEVTQLQNQRENIKAENSQIKREKDDMEVLIQSIINLFKLNIVQNDHVTILESFKSWIQENDKKRTQLENDMEAFKEQQAASLSEIKNKSQKQKNKLDKYSTWEKRIRKTFSPLLNMDDRSKIDLEKFTTKISDWVRDTQEKESQYQKTVSEKDQILFEKDLLITNLNTKYNEKDNSFTELNKKYTEQYKWIEHVKENFIKLYPMFSKQWDIHLIPVMQETFTKLNTFYHHLNEQMEILQSHFNTKFDHTGEFAKQLISITVKYNEYENLESRKRKKTCKLEGEEKCKLIDSLSYELKQCKLKIDSLEKERNACVQKVNELSEELNLLKQTAPNLMLASSSGSNTIDKMKHLFLQLFIHHFRLRYYTLSVKMEAIQASELKKFTKRIQEVFQKLQENDMCELALLYMNMDINSFTSIETMDFSETENMEAYLNQCVKETRNYIEQMVRRHGKVNELVASVSDRLDLLELINHYDGLDTALDRLRTLEQKYGMEE